MPALALDKCSLLSIFVESLLWGIFLSLYVITLFLLLQKRSNIAKHTPHLVLATVMFVLCTMHVSLSFQRVMDAFFRSPHPIPHLEDITNGPFRFKNGVHIAQLFMSDLLIVFRSFMLWDKNYFVVLVSVLVVGSLVAGAGALRAMSFTSHAGPIFEGSVHTWMTATLALALITKAICLFLVIFRVQQIHASLTSHVNRHIAVYTTLVVLVESGAVALVTSVILLPMFVTKMNAHYIVWDALSPVMGITFTTMLAATTVNLSNRTPPSAMSRPKWNRYSTPISPSRAAPKGPWGDSQDDVDIATTNPPSPVLSRSPSMHNANKSTGTLNMGIVI